MGNAKLAAEIVELVGDSSLNFPQDADAMPQDGLSAITTKPSALKVHVHEPCVAARMAGVA